MTRDPARRRGARPFDMALRLDAVTLLAVLVVIGLLLRAFIAGIYLPQSGFRIDTGDFAAWAQRLASGGPGAFYAPDYFSDYPPGYLYVLWGLGAIGSFARGFIGMDITPGLVKLPGVLADAGVAVLLFVICRRFLDGRWGRSGATIGLVAATVYLFNPGTIFNSSVWGQVDSVGALAVLATVYLLARGWTEAAAVGAVIALLIKFQFGLLIPVVAVVGIKRHLLGRSSDPTLAHPDATRVLTSLAAGVGSLLVLILPFGLSVWSPSDPSHSLIGKFIDAADTYKGLSINAFNLWRNPWSGLGNVNQWGNDTIQTGVPGGLAFTVGSMSVTWQLVGMLLFGAVAAVAVWQVARRDDLPGLLLATLLLAVAFFVLPTRVHERYLFPALALAAPLVLRNWRWASLYAVLSVSFFANVYWAYTIDWSYVPGPPINPGANGLPMARDSILAATVLSDWGIYLLAAMIVGALLWLVWRSLLLGWRAARARDPAAAPEAMPGGESDAPLPSAALLPSDAPLPGLPPGDRQRRGWGWLRTQPRDPLFREPMRRLDRLDLLLVLAFVVLAFGFRLWRLDLPRAMHFDEVYHARSATEWLADWEHGWKRDTYEWTHPMLAKYLIAAGILAADPNKVIATTAIGAPATSLAVAPRRSAHDHPRSIVFLGSGDQVIARDALSGDQVASWSAGASVAALAYDPDAERLLVGSSSSGQVLVYSLDAFLRHLGPRAPPPPAPPIESGLASVHQIVIPWRPDLSQPAPPADDVLLLAGNDGFAELQRATGDRVASSRLQIGGIGYVPANGGAGLKATVVVTDVRGGDVLLLDPATLRPRGDGQDRVHLPSTPIGPLLVRGSANDLQVWVPIGPLPANDEHGPVQGGMSVLNERLSLVDSVALPGSARGIAWQDTANIVYVSGVTPAGNPVVWTVDPLGDERSGFATFDSTSLPGQPLAMAIDSSNLAEADDNANLLVSTAADNGVARLVTIDAGSNAFAWRLAGIVFGALLVGLIYLLAATMFRRRRIAVLAAAFVTFDGMSYVMSRIAMNDIYVATFIVAAYLVFWQIWSGRWARSAWWALPLVGVLIGLAAASKWVGWYALAGLWIMVLARSALGRLVLVAGAAFLVVVAGFDAPWPFSVLMVASLGLALWLVWLRPVRISAPDLAALPATGVVAGGIGLAFALAYGQVPGRTPTSSVELIFAFLARGAQAAWPAWIMLAAGGLLLIARAARSLRRPESDRRWMRPDEMAGFAWPWMGACLLILPLLVYFIAYIPYLELGHAIALKDTGPGYGWSLDELHAQMFAYHFDLQSGHPSASPWWSWPLDLKPVWFYGHSFPDARQNAVIYNGGNPILFWAGVPAIVYCAVQAWRRRSLALVLIVAAFAFQFLPWTRIERATFHYHYFTAALFAMVAVAYATDDLLRSREWSSLGIAFLVAAAVAGALVFPLNSALAMPDWYINAARALPPWNYDFQFPGPPKGNRGQLFSGNILQLAVGSLLAVAAAAFAMYGRDVWQRLAFARAHHEERGQDNEPSPDDEPRGDDEPRAG